MDDIHYLNRDEVKLIDIVKFNQLANTNYKNVYALYNSPISFIDELNVRNKIINNSFDLSCVIVLDTIEEGKYEIFLESKTYDDVREKIIPLNI